MSLKIALALHVLAACVWLGGMVFGLFALRPALLQASLTGPQKLALQSTVMGRFFQWVWGAVAILLLTGLHLYGLAGSVSAGAYAQTMLGIGLTMMMVFAHLYFAVYRRLPPLIQSQDWEAVAALLNQGRRLMQVNLGLGVLAIVLVKVLR
jgi:uncharacterized membrane protein